MRPVQGLAHSRGDGSESLRCIVSAGVRQIGAPMIELRPHLGHLACVRLALGVPHQPLLSCLEEVLAPPIVQVGRDAFPPAQAGDARLAPEAFQHDPDLLLCRVLLPGHPADGADGGFPVLLLLGYSASRFAILGLRIASYQTASSVSFGLTTYSCGSLS